MKCPNCGHGEHRVVRTDEAEDKIVRSRDCLQCAHRFRTAEVPVQFLSRANDIVEAFGQMKRAVGEE